MSFKILLLPPDVDASWPEKIRQAVPGAVAKAFSDPQDALTDMADADAAYGTVPPELFALAKKLRWICAARAGLGGAWFYDALVKSAVVVTNMRGSYNEHLSAHAVAFLLAFARRFEHYLPQKQWQRGPGMIDLPTQTVLIVGVDGAGSEADFVIVTTPETPETLGMFNASLFSRMKRGSYFINIARSRCVVTADLIAALRSGQLAGAGLDVVDPEPLPPDSPLWRMPNVLITPHVAISGAPYRQKWEEILLENCRRFARHEPLLNVVDKEKWYRRGNGRRTLPQALLREGTKVSG